MCNADVNALPGWLGKEFDAKGGRPLPCFEPWQVFLDKRAETSKVGLQR